MTERSYHHGNLRAALLDRAWEVVDSEGAEALSLRQLARDLDVSHGASGRHFRDKQALLDAVAVLGFARLNAALADAVDTAGPFAGRFRAAQGAGELPPRPPEEAALVAFAAVHGVATLATDDLLDGVPWEDATAATIAAGWRGLASPPVG